MPKFVLTQPGAKDLASSDAEIAYYKAIEQKVKAEEAAKKEAQKKRSIAMGLPESALEEKPGFFRRILGSRKNSSTVH
ncbi:hypothetical protein GJ744_001490 [Endocarpon pusillum]|uniref:Uncharacterized protein n=1 Tax=Endocarpon pusillum TaxID=364733 RepID=A0A8H7ADC5_9EURO|nr:hypothetical protein GJ744_001490 [Endocarpon pusillum]